MCSQLSLDKLLCPGVWHWFQCALLSVFHWIFRKKRFPMCRWGLKLYQCVFRVQVVSVFLCCKLCVQRLLWFIFCLKCTTPFSCVLWYMDIRLHLWTMLQPPHPPPPRPQTPNTEVLLSPAGRVWFHPPPPVCDSRTWGQDLKFPLSVSFFLWLALCTVHT